MVMNDEAVLVTIITIMMVTTVMAIMVMTMMMAIMLWSGPDHVFPGAGPAPRVLYHDPHQGVVWTVHSATPSQTEIRALSYFVPVPRVVSARIAKRNLVSVSNE